MKSYKEVTLITLGCPVWLTAVLWQDKTSQKQQKSARYMCVAEESSLSIQAAWKKNEKSPQQSSLKVGFPSTKIRRKWLEQRKFQFFPTIQNLAQLVIFYKRNFLFLLRILGNPQSKHIYRINVPQ